MKLSTLNPSDLKRGKSSYIQSDGSNIKTTH